MEENKVMEQKIENEDELFHSVEYSPEAAEMIGYSDTLTGNLYFRT